MMLPFHEHVAGELVQEDGLVVMGAGLGFHKVLASLLRLHSSSDGIVFVLSASDSQKQATREELQAQDIGAVLPVEINNECSRADKLDLYAQGGVFFITSRILIVDMLNEKVPMHRIAGMIVLNAHRLSETCAEAFIARLYRARNKEGFMRAFSDKPQAMISGFSKPERIMRSLFVRKMHLWPRFHLTVASALEENPPEVIDIRIPLTSFMQGIQSAILEVMEACLKELKKTNRVDAEDLTIENGLFKSFDEIIRRQLDPVWHVIGRKTKQLVGDLRTLRKLSDYLVRYDAVTFLKYLDTLRVSEGVRSVWIFASSAHRIFELAKRRVFQMVRADIGNSGFSGALDRTFGELSKRGRALTRGGRGRGTGWGRGRGTLQENNVQGLGQSGKPRKLNDNNAVVDEDSQDDGSGKVEDEESADGKAEMEKPGSDRSVLGGDAQGVELEVMVEEMPKWKVFREILEEIEEERRKKTTDNVLSCQDIWGDGDGAGMVLVACKDERTCLQLQDCITKGPQKLMNEEWEMYLLGRVELHGMQTRKRKRNKEVKGLGILDGKAPVVPVDTGEANSALRQEQDALLVAAAEVTAREMEVIELGDDSARGRRHNRHGRGRGRCRGRKVNGQQGRKFVGQGKGKSESGTLKKDTSNISVAGEESTFLQHRQIGVADGKVSASIEEGLVQKVDESNAISQEENKTEKLLPPINFYALESEQRILDVIRPSYVVVYDPDMAFVREMEVYKAEHPTNSLKVYFLFYENSTEVQKFEAGIQRENSAFESLIRQKASMTIPVDQDGRMLESTPPQAATGVALNAITRKAGGRKAPEKQMQIVVDMREFGSSLPCVLYQQGFRILPVVLEIGDYVLSPDMCVERKSVADLFSSFASGRLYHQAEIMTRHYRTPVLLIEFSQDKSFSLQSANDVGEDIVAASILSKLSLLVLHFPRLRLVWSRSLHATADIFITLKTNQDEPDVEKAMRVGVPTEDGLIEGDARAETYNTTAVEFLRRLPGVTDANYKSLMDGCKCLADLALLPVERLAELMGGHRPARMLRDFLDAKCPMPV